MSYISHTMSGLKKLRSIRFPQMYQTTSPRILNQCKGHKLGKIQQIRFTPSTHPVLHFFLWILESCESYVIAKVSDCWMLNHSGHECVKEGSWEWQFNLIKMVTRKVVYWWRLDWAVSSLLFSPLCFCMFLLFCVLLSEGCRLVNYPYDIEGE